MTSTGTISLLLILANVVFTFKGLRDPSFYERFRFEVDKVLIQKDYKRIITSGFLHTGWMHLIFNMLCLLSFGGMLESYLGGVSFLLLYFSSLIGGELLSLYLHRHHGNYGSVGASGAVCGIIFATIALFPGLQMGLFFLPIAFPAWIYGALFMAYTIYGIRSGSGNTGHDAHMGGALIGMGVALLMVPSALAANYMIILLLSVPALAFLYISVTRPHLFIFGSRRRKTVRPYTMDDAFNMAKANKEKELDALLEKVHKKGMAGLSQKEKALLKEYAQNS
jgi:membrane associated rhomboid family serine protease